MTEIKGKIDAAICFAKIIGAEAVEQIGRICGRPLTVGGGLRITPDVRAGKGRAVGAGRVFPIEVLNPIFNFKAP